MKQNGGRRLPGNKLWRRVDACILQGTSLHSKSYQLEERWYKSGNGINMMQHGRPPWPGPAARSGVPRRDRSPGGPNCTKGKIHYRLEPTELYPYCESGISGHSKTDKLHVNVQLPSSRGTTINELTLQVNNNPQHDTNLSTANSKPPWLCIITSPHKRAVVFNHKTS